MTTLPEAKTKRVGGLMFVHVCISSSSVLASDGAGCMSVSMCVLIQAWGVCWRHTPTAQQEAGPTWHAP